MWWVLGAVIVLVLSWLWIIKFLWNDFMNHIAWSVTNVKKDERSLR